MAGRLNKVIGNYVGDDKTGFIKDKYMRDNIRRVMNINELVQKEKNPCGSFIP